MFGAGALGFFAVPYTVMIYPLLYIVFPRLWSVAHKHGYVTSADFVRGRYGNRWLALAIAFTGILATMPYIALQLVGIQVVIGAMGVETAGFAGDLPLIIAFVILAAFTYTSGLRAPAMIAVVKDLLIYITVFAAIIAVPIHLGGYDKVFSAIPSPKLLLAHAAGRDRTASFSAYATLALGSACALFLYPHSITGILSSSSCARGAAQRRDAAGLFADAGAAGAGRLHGDRHRRAVRCRSSPTGSNATRQQLLGPGAVPGPVPELVRRRRVRRHRHRSAGARRRSCRSPPQIRSRATSTASSCIPPAPTHRKARWRRSSRW